MSDTPSAGAWRADPTGRYAQRWHDGSKWTEHVADAQGTTSSDPYPVEPPAPAYTPSQETNAPSWPDPTTVEQPGGGQGDPTAVGPAGIGQSDPTTAYAGPPHRPQPPGEPQTSWPSPAYQPYQQAPPGWGTPPAGYGPPGYAPPYGATPAAAPTKARARFSAVGLVLVVLGGAAVVVGLFALGWIRGTGIDASRTKLLTGGFHRTITNAHDITFMTDAFASWGAYAALVVGIGLAIIAVFVRKLMPLAFLIAALCGVWAGFVGFDLAHFLHQDFHLNAAAGAGAYVTAIGFFVAAIGAILPAPRRR